MKQQINVRIIGKIDSSDLDKPIKEMIKQILLLQSQLSKGEHYSKRYEYEIDRAYASLIRGMNN